MTTASITWAAQPPLARNAIHWATDLLSRMAGDCRTNAALCSPAILKNNMCSGKVLVLPGMMGSRLSVGSDSALKSAWLHPAHIAAGGIADLKWPAPVKATGALSISYAQLLMRLRLADLDADFLPYDWRQSPDLTGTALIAQLREQGQRKVTLVCHSMGGLVARQMAAADPNGSVIAKVITIGTPNHGSYAPLRMFDLSHPTLATLARIDKVHDARALVQDYLRDFPGLLAMLPALVLDTASWPAGVIQPCAAKLAQANKAMVALPSPDERFHQIIGTGHSTTVAARAGQHGFHYDMTDDGDGVVACASAEMGDVTPHYVRSSHAQLFNNDTVISTAIDTIRRAKPIAVKPKAVTTQPTHAGALPIVRAGLLAKQKQRRPRRTKSYRPDFA